MSDYFPPEILDEILHRLPSKSLCRFLAVSKSWYARITTNSFVSLNLKHNLKNQENTHLLLRVYNYKEEIESFSFYPYHETETETETPLGVPSSVLMPPHKSFIGYHRIVGHGNGLICLTDDIFSANVDIVLWNPSIRKCLSLPTPGIMPDCPYRCMLGFGVDLLNGDVKVVRVVYRGDDELRYEAVPLVEVYSLRTGTWRRVEDGGVGGRYPSLVVRTPAYVNGCPHWGFFRETGVSGNFIGSFDMSDEVFREILLPKDIAHSSTNSWVVTDYRECLAVVGVDPAGHCFIWMMSEYGNTESWTKLYGVDVELTSRFVGFRRNGDIFMQTSKNELALLDPNKGSVVELGIFGSGRAMYANKYVESLILIDHEVLDG